MEEFDPARSALLVMDFQHYGLDPKGYWPQRLPAIVGRFTREIENTARAVKAARRAGVTVIFVGQAWRKGLIDANVNAPWQADREGIGTSYGRDR